MELATFGRAAAIDKSILEDYLVIAAKVARYLVDEYYK
jgi:hypothetical protein